MTNGDSRTCGCGGGNQRFSGSQQAGNLCIGQFTADCQWLGIAQSVGPGAARPIRLGVLADPYLYTNTLSSKMFYREKNKKVMGRWDGGYRPKYQTGISAARIAAACTNKTRAA